MILTLVVRNEISGAIEGYQKFYAQDAGSPGVRLITSVPITTCTLFFSLPAGARAANASRKRWMLKVRNPRYRGNPCRATPQSSVPSEL